MIIHPQILPQIILTQTQKGQSFESSHPFVRHHLIDVPTGTDGQSFKLFELPDILSVNLVKVEQVQFCQFWTVRHQSVEIAIRDPLDVR